MQLWTVRTTQRLKTVDRQLTLCFEAPTRSSAISQAKKRSQTGHFKRARPKLVFAFPGRNCSIMGNINIKDD